MHGGQRTASGETLKRPPQFYFPQIGCRFALPYAEWITVCRRGNVEAPGGIDRICHGTFFILKVARSALLTGEVKSCPTKMPPCAKRTKLRLPSESIEGRHGALY